MCHNSAVHSEQIGRFVEIGMPQKIVKTLQYTLKKRAKKAKAQVENENATTTLSQVSTVTGSTVPLLTSNNITTAIEPIVNAVAADFVKNEYDDDNNYDDGVVVNENLSEIVKVREHSDTVISDVNDQLNEEHQNQQTKLTLKMSTTTIDEQSKNNNNANANENQNEIKIPKLCGRFRKLGNKDGAAPSSSSSSSVASTNNANDMDVLAVGTQMTRRFAQRIGREFERIQSSHLYTMLTKTAQPAHIIAICIVAFVISSVWPDIMDTNHSSTNETLMKTVPSGVTISSTESHVKQTKRYPLALIAYLGAFATHFGSQIWMTFVSGLSLYFSLPRHTFGQCQQILFPKYFAMNASLSIGMLILYTKYILTKWTLASSLQLSSVALCAILEVVIRLYLAPPMLLLMHEKYKIEGSIGSGKEVGNLVQGDLILCPHYQRVHKGFRRIHMTIAIGNMIILMATCLHLYFIASKIQIN